MKIYVPMYNYNSYAHICPIAEASTAFWPKLNVLFTPSSQNMSWGVKERGQTHHRVFDKQVENNKVRRT